MRRILANRYLLALLLVTAVAAEFGLASIAHPAALASPQTPAPARAAVSAVVRACPAPGSAGATAAGLALAAASAGTGEATITRLSPSGSTATPAPLRVLAQPGRLVLVEVPAAPVLGRKVTRGPIAAPGSAVPTGPARGGVMIQASGSRPSRPRPGGWRPRSAWARPPVSGLSARGRNRRPTSSFT